MNDRVLNVEIVTPQNKVFTGEAIAVTVPGSKSAFQILYNHAPIVSSLDEGRVKILDANNKEFIYKTASGFAEVAKNKISILVESAELLEN